MKSLLLEKLKGPKVAIGLVSGSDLVKVSEQMGKDCLSEFDFVFPENGLVAYKNGVEIGRKSIASFMGEEKLQKFINFCLGYMSKLELPIKRGTFIEFRNGLINICPPGRSVSIIITWAKLQRAAGESDAVNRIRFLYICRALGN